MRLLLCKSYEMSPSARASKGQEVTEMRLGKGKIIRLSMLGLLSGLTLAAPPQAPGAHAPRRPASRGAPHPRAGRVARRAPRPRLAGRPRAIRPSGLGAARRLAFRPGPGLALRASSRRVGA